VKEKTPVTDSSHEVRQIDPTRGILPQIFPFPFWIAPYNSLLIKALFILAKILLKLIIREDIYGGSFTI
jgi:hypothetical protein